MKLLVTRGGPTILRADCGRAKGVWALEQGDLGSSLDTDACWVSGLINYMLSVSMSPVNQEGPKEIVLSPVYGT